MNKRHWAFGNKHTIRDPENEVCLSLLPIYSLFGFEGSSSAAESLQVRASPI
jgi:hypothetical protein